MSFDMRLRPRRNVHTAAWIGFDGETRLQRCTLVDISEDGARLAIEEAEDLPDQFNLVLSRFGRPSHQCSVVWKVTDQVGVKFIAPSPKATRAATGAIETFGLPSLSAP